LSLTKAYIDLDKKTHHDHKYQISKTRSRDDALLIKYHTDDSLIQYYIDRNKESYHMYQLHDPKFEKNNYWFGFNSNENLLNCFALLNIDVKLLALNEGEFNNYTIEDRRSIVHAIRKLSFHFKNKIYLKILNKLTTNKQEPISSTISNKKDLFFMKFFQNFCVFHNVDLFVLSQTPLIGFDFLNKNKNLRIALLDFQECMSLCTIESNISKYTISNFLNWYNQTGFTLLRKYLFEKDQKNKMNTSMDLDSISHLLSDNKRNNINLPSDLTSDKTSYATIYKNIDLQMLFLSVNDSKNKNKNKNRIPIDETPYNKK